MSEPLLHALTLIGAFWTAVLGYAARGGESRDAARFVGGLALGAAATHAGWGLLHPGAVMTQPMLMLDPSAGYTVLALPVGLLATVPWRARAKRRVHYLAASLGALPLAIVVARIGCCISKCCHGNPTGLPWGVVVPGEPLPVHPTPVYEALGWIGVVVLLRRLERAWIGPTVLIAFGALRLASEPLRAPAPLGPPLVAPMWIALSWAVGGLLLSPVLRRLLGSRRSPGRTTPSACPTLLPHPHRTLPRLRHRTLLCRGRRAARTRSAS